MELRKRSYKQIKYLKLKQKRIFQIKNNIFYFNNLLSKLFLIERNKYKSKRLKSVYKKLKKKILIVQAIILKINTNIQQNIENAIETYVTDFKRIVALNNYSDEYMLVQNFRDRVSNILNSNILSKFLKYRSQYNFDLYSYLLKPSNLLFFNKLSNFFNEIRSKS